MAPKEYVLLTLAVEQFPDLTDAERDLLWAVTAGRIADYRRPNAENDPQHAETWDASRTIRAPVIRWLCTDPEASRQIDPRGISIRAATIEGWLDLAYVTLPVPLGLRQCAVEGGVTLVDADTRTLRFSGSVLGSSGESPLDATGAHVRGWVFLNEGFQAAGEVRLLGASIDGTLDCRGGTFAGTTFLRPPGNALQADGARVGGNVFLDGDFRAEGTVRLVGAHVGQLFDDEASWPTPGNLRLDRFVYTAFAVGPIDAKARLAWLERQPSRPFQPQPYLQLAKVLRESGHEVGAKQVLIEKERALRKYGDLGWGAWCGNWLLDVFLGYGYRPRLVWVGFWVMVGGMLFGMGYDKEIVIPTKAEAYDSDKKTRQEPAFYPAFNRWLYALDTFVPIINFGQKDYWGPQVACNKPGLIGGGGIRLCIFGIRALYLYWWLHLVAGWVLITLGVTGFTNLVR